MNSESNAYKVVNVELADRHWVTVLGVLELHIKHQLMPQVEKLRYLNQGN